MNGDPYLAPGTPPARRRTGEVECENCRHVFECEGWDELGVWVPEVDECPECGLSPYDDQRPRCAECDEPAEWDDGLWRCPEHGILDQE